MNEQSIWIGCGAGFSGDRVDAPQAVVRALQSKPGRKAIVFENLAERTLAFAQLARRVNPATGYEPLLEQELLPVLASCVESEIAIVGNFGAANPRGAALAIQKMAERCGLRRLRIAVVLGDALTFEDVAPLMPAGDRYCTPERYVSASAYQGAFDIASAIASGADVVVTGRVADSALVLGPAIAWFGWKPDQWDLLAAGTMAGHLLECGVQVTGGYFCDPGKKDLPDVWNLGYPIAEIASDGACVISKPQNTGGAVNVRTVTEQLLYEIHDPAAYLNPDVVADLSNATLEQIAPDQVRLTGVKGHPRPDTLKSNVYFSGGWIGEGEISYAGINAEARARLAMEILRKRLPSDLVVRYDLIGVHSIMGDGAGRSLTATARGSSQDVRLRVAAAHDERQHIERLLQEVNALYTAGPAGGGGVRTSRRERLVMRSCLVPRSLAPTRVEYPFTEEEIDEPAAETV